MENRNVADYVPVVLGGTKETLGYLERRQARRELPCFQLQVIEQLPTEMAQRAADSYIHLITFMWNVAWARDKEGKMFRADVLFPTDNHELLHHLRGFVPFAVFHGENRG